MHQAGIEPANLSVDGLKPCPLTTRALMLQKRVLFIPLCSKGGFL